MDIRDLGDVIQKLEEAQFNKPDWERLGRELGLHQNTVYMIRTNENGDVDKCFTECLSKWLSRADDVDSKGKPTFSSLADALGRMGKKNEVDYISKSITKTISLFSVIITMLLVYQAYMSIELTGGIALM